MRGAGSKLTPQIFFLCSLLCDSRLGGRRVLAGTWRLSWTAEHGLVATALFAATPPVLRSPVWSTGWLVPVMLVPPSRLKPPS